MAINYNKVPVKYITGTFQYEESYPTTSDLLFEMATICGSKFKYEKLLDIVKVEEETIQDLLGILQDDGYVKISNGTITIIKTPWDGESND